MHDVTKITHSQNQLKIVHRQQMQRANFGPFPSNRFLRKSSKFSGRFILPSYTTISVASNNEDFFVFWRGNIAGRLPE